MGEHWTVRAKDMDCAPSANPLWGHLGEDDDGDLWLPSWTNPHRDMYSIGWWGRRLDLRRPTHWLPYLRSRMTRRVVWLDV